MIAASITGFFLGLAIFAIYVLIAAAALKRKQAREITQ